MTARILFYVFTFVLAAAVVYFLAKTKSLSGKVNYSIRKNRKELFRNLIKVKGNEKEYNKLFIMAGLNIDVYQYQVIRYIMLSLVLIIMFAASKMDLSRMLGFNLFVCILLFAITTPKRELFGKKTPFVIVMDLLTTEQRNKKNLEISRALSQLKNLTMTRKDNPPSALFIFDQLRKYTKTLKPVFNRMIALYNENKKEEAERYFVEAVGTRESEALANLLMKLDNLAPAELREQLTVYQENIKKERETNKLKKIERGSYQIYFVVIISVFIMLMNFVVVVYTIDSLELLKFLQ